MTHHEVRQVLMNELGLTRESVRGIAAEVVQSTVQKQLETSGYLEKLVEAIVERNLRELLKPDPYRTSTDPLTGMVLSAAKRAAEQAITAAVRIEVTKP